MAVQSQTVSINFGRGIDTKTDPKLVISTKLLELQNAVFTQGGQLRKRNGYDAMSLEIVGGGTITSPTMTESYKNELLLAGQNSSGDNRLYSYSPGLGAWSDRGQYFSVAVSKEEISGVTPASTSNGQFTNSAFNSSLAVLGNVSLYAYDLGQGPQALVPFADGLPDGGYPAASSNNSVYIVVVDNETGAQLSVQKISSAYGTILGYSKAFLIGNSQLAVFYISDSSPSTDPTTTAKLCFQTVTVTAGGVSLGTEVQVGSPLSYTSTGTAQNFPYCYSLVSTASLCIAALSAAPDVILYSISTAGAVTLQDTISSTSNITPVQAVLDSTQTNVWIYWVSAPSSPPSTLYCAVYNASTFASVASATSLKGSIENIQQICAVNTSASEQTVFVSSYAVETETLAGIYSFISSQTNSLSGSTVTPGTYATFLPSADIYASPFVYGGRSYLPIMTLSPTQPTGMIVDMNANVIAQFLPSEAEGLVSTQGDDDGSTTVAPFLLAIRYPGMLNQLFNIEAEQFTLCCGYLITIQTAAAAISSTNLSVYPVTTASTCSMGVCAITFDFDSIDAYQSVTQQDTLVLNGGAVQQYDGQSITELGFLQYPEILTGTVASTGGSLGSGLWNYYAVYQWTDALGNLHQSAPSVAVAAFTNTGDANQVILNVSSCVLSKKTNVGIAVYKTASDGTIAYLIGVYPSGTGPVEVVDDGAFADATLPQQPELYTAGGAILENLAPPPAMVMWVNNNRAWLVDSENPETLVEYSKTAASGYGISFSTGQLELVVDSKFGAITGASPMDEKTVLLKESGVCYFYGDGASDAGTGATISNILFIPSDVGCENSKSVILYPNGILFKSPKGIYLVSRGVQVSYFGMDVEIANTQNVLSALIMEGTTQIRFLTNSGDGSSLVYDYIFNQWGNFTNHEGVSATIWNGLYVYVRADGTVYIENDDTYLDDTSSFAVLIQTSWIKANTIQNFQRVWEFELLGDYSCAANDTTYGVQMSFAYDFVSSFVPANVIPFSPTSGADTPFQERFFPSQQKCNAIQIQIAELPTGASGEYIDFSDLDMEIAVKRGLNKLSPFQSTG